MLAPAFMCETKHAGGLLDRSLPSGAKCLLGLWVLCCTNQGSTDCLSYGDWSSHSLTWTLTATEHYGN